MRLAAVFVFLALCSGRPALAEPTESSASVTEAKVTLPVVLKLDPRELDGTELAALVALLEADLGALGHPLRVESSTAREADWLARFDGSERVLLASLRAGRDEWLVTLVDPVQRRAVRRELPGGSQGNAAALEAAASIIVSAAMALAEGEPVASTPLEEVLRSEAVPPPEPPAAREPEAPNDDSLPPPRRTWLRADLGASVATFAEGTPVLIGLGVGLGVERAEGAFVEARGTYEPEMVITTPFGSLPLQRSRVGLVGGPVFSTPPLRLLPYAGVALEVLDRRASDPAPGVLPTSAKPFVHLGGALGLAIETPLIGPLWLRGMLQGAIFPRPVRFTATASDRVLLAPWPWSGTGFLGLSGRL